MQQSYKIYFDGEIASNFNPEEVKKRAQVVFRLSEEKTAILFNGSSHILKESLSDTECAQYLDQLLHIGLIAKSDPLLHAETISYQESDVIAEEPYHELNADSGHEPQEIIEPKAKKISKALPIALLALIVAGGGIYAWQSGLIELPFLNEDHSIEQPITITPPAPKPAAEKQPESANIQAPQETAPTETRDTETTEVAIEDINTPIKSPIIEECSDPEVINLLEKVLAQGIPQLVQRSSPDVNLTIKTYDNNQELYFDQTRNKRLCGVLAQFSIAAPNIPTNIENPSVVYEIIYEIQREEDQSVRLNTFRQKIISSNLQNTNTIN
ncbi:MAG: hypothetical protein ACRCXK_01520 [Wohlfahrtiimonas sp.]